MKNRHQRELLINPIEICQINHRAVAMDDMDTIKAIRAEFQQQNEKYRADYDYYTMKLYSTIYQAGRIQGIREERMRRACKRES